MNYNQLISADIVRLVYNNSTIDLPVEKINNKDSELAQYDEPNISPNEMAINEAILLIFTDINSAIFKLSVSKYLVEFKLLTNSGVEIYSYKNVFEENFTTVRKYTYYYNTIFKLKIGDGSSERLHYSIDNKSHESDIKKSISQYRYTDLLDINILKNSYSKGNDFTIGNIFITKQFNLVNLGSIITDSEDIKQ